MVEHLRFCNGHFQGVFFCAQFKLNAMNNIYIIRFVRIADESDLRFLGGEYFVGIAVLGIQLGLTICNEQTWSSITLLCQQFVCVIV